MKYFLLLILFFHVSLANAQFEAPIETPILAGPIINWINTPIDQNIAEPGIHNGNSHIKYVLSPQQILIDDRIISVSTTFRQNSSFPDYNGFYYEEINKEDGTLIYNTSIDYETDGRQNIPFSLFKGNNNNEVNLICMRNTKVLDYTGTSLFGGIRQFSTHLISPNGNTSSFGDESDSTILTTAYPAGSPSQTRSFPTGIIRGDTSFVTTYFTRRGAINTEAHLVIQGINQHTGKTIYSSDTMVLQHDITNIANINGGQLGNFWDDNSETKGMYMYTLDIDNPSNSKFVIFEINKEFREIGTRTNIISEILNQEEMYFSFTSRGELLFIFKDQGSNGGAGWIVKLFSKKGELLRSSDLILTDSRQEYYTSNGYGNFYLDKSDGDFDFYLLLRKPGLQSMDVIKIGEDGTTTLETSLLIDPLSNDFDFITMSPSVLAIDEENIITQVEIRKIENGNYIGSWSHTISFSLDTMTNIIENPLTNSITLFPNPSSGLLKYSVLSGIDLTSIIVKDISGRTVSILDPRNSETSLHHLTGGCYFVEFKTSNSSISLPWIKR